jgi:hypothetical protein
MITSRVFDAPAGGTEIFHYSLRRVRILGVEREGIGLEIISGVLTPSGNEVAYLGVGRLKFDTANPFFGGTTSDIIEKIYVLYET